MKAKLVAILIACVAISPATGQPLVRNMEWLDRGLVAVKQPQGVFLSWRVLGTDPAGLGFNLYRGTTKINAVPLTGATNFVDAQGTLASTYTVRPVLNGTEQTTKDPVTKVLPTFWKSVPIQIPPGGSMPSGDSTLPYSYTAGDVSTGDLDGDGRLDLVVAWTPSNQRDNSQGGATGNEIYDAYTMEGKRLWRIDLGPNIRAGGHYNTVVVADFDGNGKAEMMVKSAPGTKDASGQFLSKGPAANDTDKNVYRNSAGYILSGPEYLTVFDGPTGRELATVPYNPGRGSVSAWGDSYGNRVDRFLSTAAWLDGIRPSGVFQRGYYTRMAIAAWDWDGKALTQKWFFDSDKAGNEAANSQGNHNLSVGDVDGDGKDEIIQGAAAIDHDGKFMYATGLGHGDAMHLSDLCPERPGLEVWMGHEHAPAGALTSEVHDAKTGELLWGDTTTGDIGRALAADIDPAFVGYEMWSTGTTGTFACNGKTKGAMASLVSTSRPSWNFRVYWDGDLQDELLDGTKLDKWNVGRLVSLYNYGVTQINGTKATPNLSADLFGDWREEIVMRSNASDSLKIFTTTIPTSYRLYTLMHDPVYRAAISWQNTGYNQPPHLGFLLSDTAKWPKPSIKLVGQTSTPTGIAASPAPKGNLRNHAGIHWLGQPSLAVPSSLAQDARTLELLDLNGRVAFRVTVSEGRIRLPAGLPHGAYLLRAP